MEYIADLHVHSRYSRATSKALGIFGLFKGSRAKGIDIMGTGDFTHPLYFQELKEQLVPLGTGLYRHQEDDPKDPRVKFILTQELSGIYKRGGKVRRIHNLVLAPSLEIVEEIIKRLEPIGNLSADGRPILGLDSEELLKIVLDVSPECMLIPAHIWTPWFSLFGSKSGFDSIQECFGDMSKHIYAIETGLSSDPLMNWMIQDLDTLAILSNGDAHSAPNIAREANVFELAEASYMNVARAIKNSGTFNKKNLPKEYVKYTIEFYPEEGKYHFDGHRECNVSLHPQETKKYQGVCPVCKRSVTIGVLNRVHELAGRSEAEAREFGRMYKSEYKSMVPLAEIIADAYGVSKTSKKVIQTYDALLNSAETELALLLKLPLDNIAAFAEKEIVQGIKRMRNGDITICPGFDGVYGKVSIFKESERNGKAVRQQKLF
ncbi:MAG: hypothetical protein UW24_C0019G0016 [Parcubacteria group bacterium GW2011_GWA2_44_12]|nr:MAG: hypothetical protein UW24_C0019G0016 [Parcubacteria group bacterium GW2011_GWA2_44_12]